MRGRRQPAGVVEQPEGPPPAETAAEILRNGGSARRSRAAARVGLTAAVVAGAAVAAGVAGLSLLANSGGDDHAAVRDARSGVGPATAISGPPLRVLAVSPPARSSRMSGSASVRIDFSARLAPTSAAPTFRPAVAGRWRARGSVLSFTPRAPFAPLTRYTLVIPAGKAGLRSASGGAIATTKAVIFRTPGYSPCQHRHSSGADGVRRHAGNQSGRLCHPSQRR